MLAVTQVFSLVLNACQSAMHPTLSRFLRLVVFDHTATESRDAWSRAFVDVLGTIADEYAPKQLHIQRPVFYALGANFRSALAEAERQGMDQHIAMLTQSLAVSAQNERDFHGAAALFAQLADHAESKELREYAPTLAMPK